VEARLRVARRGEGRKGKRGLLRLEEVDGG
jgi:hypothetical protein